MPNILITGGAGFIGSSLADRLVQDPNNYIVIADSLLTGDMAKLPDPRHKNWKFVKCDVNQYPDIAALMCACRFDFVFHYAAVVGVQRTLSYPVMVLNDIQGIKNVLELSKNTGVQRVFYASSSEVYGESVSYPQDEIGTPLNSRLPYAVVKNVGESFCRSYHQEYGLDFTIFRFFNTYGPKQSPDFVVARFIEAALADQAITIHGDGSQSRTFCYIDDHIEATTRAFYEQHFVNAVVNIGNDTETSVLQLAQTIIDVCGSKSPVIHIPPRKEGEMSRRVPQIDRMRSLLLQQAHIPLSEGISHIVKALRDAK